MQHFFFSFYVDGMSCNGCADRLASQLRMMDGVVSVSVDFACKRADVTMSLNGVSAVSDLIAMVQNLGYSVLETAPCSQSTLLSTKTENAESPEQDVSKNSVNTIEECNNAPCATLSCTEDLHKCQKDEKIGQSCAIDKEKIMTNVEMELFISKVPRVHKQREESTCTSFGPMQSEALTHDSNNDEDEDEDDDNDEDGAKQKSNTKKMTQRCKAENKTVLFRNHCTSQESTKESSSLTGSAASERAKKTHHLVSKPIVTSTFTATNNAPLITNTNSSSNTIKNDINVKQKKAVTQLLIEGMSCGSCAARIERALMKIKGVHEASVNFATMSGKVMHDSSLAPVSLLRKSLEEMGYQASLQRTTAPHTPQPHDFSVFVNDDGMTHTNEYNKTDRHTNNNQVNTKEGGACEDSLLQLGRQCTKENAAQHNNSNSNNNNNSLGLMSANSSDLYTHTFKLQIAAVHTVDDASRLEHAIRKLPAVTECSVSSASGLAVVVVELHKANNNNNNNKNKECCASHSAHTSEFNTDEKDGDKIKSKEKDLEEKDTLAMPENRKSTQQEISPENIQSCLSSLYVEIVNVIHDLGYAVHEGGEGDEANSTMSRTRTALERTAEIITLRNYFIGSAILSLPLMGVMLLMSFTHVLDNNLPLNQLIDCIQLVTSSPIVFYFGWHFFERAWLGFQHGTYTMDTLVALGIGCSYLYSTIALFISIFRQTHKMTYFDTAGMLTTFMLLGRLLEARAKRQTSGALIELMSLVPPFAIAVDENNEHDVRVPSSSITVGMRLRVLAGERIPVDAQIEHGCSEVDEQMISGESVPKSVSVGDHVIGGTLNLSANIVIRAEKVGADTVLAQIVRIVQDAQSSKPSVQRIADRIAMYFVPVVIAISLLTLAVWLILGFAKAYPESWIPHDGSRVSFAFSFFIATVVAACPCALGLATPTAIMVGTGVGARNGVLVKSGVTLETVRKTTCIVFDKTGTITNGVLEVVSVDCFHNRSAKKHYRKNINDKNYSKSHHHHHRDYNINRDKANIIINDDTEHDGHNDCANVMDVEMSKVELMVGSVEALSTHPVAKAISAALLMKKQEQKANNTIEHPAELNAPDNACTTETSHFRYHHHYYHQLDDQNRHHEHNYYYDDNINNSRNATEEDIDHTHHQPISPCSLLSSSSSSEGLSLPHISAHHNRQCHVDSMLRHTVVSVLSVVTYQGMGVEAVVNVKTRRTNSERANGGEEVKRTSSYEHEAEETSSSFTDNSDDNDDTTTITNTNKTSHPPPPPPESSANPNTQEEQKEERRQSNTHNKEHRLLIGNALLLEQCGVTIPDEVSATVRERSSHGHTTVIAAVDGTVRLIISLADEPKPEACAVLQKMINKHKWKVMMVTGDQLDVAKRIAQLVNIPEHEIRAHALPATKVAVIEELQRDGHTVMFVGDGINDSPALTQANVGVALGAGTEVALEAADAVLMRNSLVDLLNLCALSRTTVWHIYGNFV